MRSPVIWRTKGWQLICGESIMVSVGNPRTVKVPSLCWRLCNLIGEDVKRQADPWNSLINQPCWLSELAVGSVRDCLKNSDGEQYKGTSHRLLLASTWILVEMPGLEDIYWRSLQSRNECDADSRAGGAGLLLLLWPQMIPSRVPNVWCLPYQVSVLL